MPSCSTWGSSVLDLKEKAGSQVGSIVSDVENLVRAVGTYAHFESVFSSPEDIDPQAFLEEYKDRHMKSLFICVLAVSRSGQR